MAEKTSYIQFGTFVAILFAKSVLFQWAAFHCLLFDSSFSVCTFYADQMLMALFVASFLFISKHRWWTILICVAEDLWNIANLIYYKTYDAFLSVEDVLLVSNMDGAWSSVTAYIDVWMVLMVCLTIGWCTLCWVFRKSSKERHWLTFGIAFTAITTLFCGNIYLMYSRGEEISTETQEEQQAQSGTDDWGELVDAYRGVSGVKRIPGIKLLAQYLREHTMLFDWLNVYYRMENRDAGEHISLSEEEVQVIESLIHEQSDCPQPQNHLILLIVESLESWPIEHEIEGQSVASFMQSFREHEHVLFCGKIKDQTSSGNSGDGQMIINTGLLPVSKGVACMHYGDNTYPNVAHFYNSSVLVNPWPHIWNQDTMSVRYGYKKRVEPDNEEWQDEHVLRNALDCMKQASEPTCICVLTVSTHSPFNRVTNNKIHTSAPAVMNRYMQCLNYTDSCIGDFVETVLDDPQLAQSTIVITGDHTIFKPAMMREFADYSRAQNLSIASGINYCPLFVYSPRIMGNMQIEEECYQMDIYPTLLELIGCDEYYWHGFGRGLLNGQSVNHRMSEQEANRVSDLIIRSNYFGR